MQNKKTELNQMRNEINELKREKEEQENLRGKIAMYYQFLEKVYSRKDVQLKKQKTLLEKLKKEKGETKKMQNQQTELDQLRNEIDELKREKEEQENLRAKMAADYQNLEKAYNEKDLQMEEQEKLLEDFKTENNEQEELQKYPVNELINEVEELKAEKEELVKLRA
ncbi:uncharacterized protein MCAP_0864-like [Palaemon carinicauda]|uniref:uncharacterized protein MCAP_0864-like n=1 Tax=Palaemon carinicauda TaxID=392227 RepID=UPI0035B5A864